MDLGDVVPIRKVLPFRDVSIARGSIGAQVCCWARIFTAKKVSIHSQHVITHIALFSGHQRRQEWVDGIRFPK